MMEGVQLEIPRSFLDVNTAKKRDMTKIKKITSNLYWKPDLDSIT
jgi:hypothetical protein